MITVRPSEQRGYADHGWLKTYHSFSFADYFDPNYMGFRTLRVINDDKVGPGQGFGMHGHRDMEIISYVVDGTLAHKDSMGNGGPIHTDEIQYMSAGSGVKHSEFNHSDTEWVRLLQIWIEPNQRGAQPRYSQTIIPRQEKLNNLKLLASGDATKDVIEVRQDVDVFASVLEKDVKVTHGFRPQRAGWLQVINGQVDVNGKTLKAGDGAAIVDEKDVLITGKERDSEFLLFDLA